MTVIGALSSFRKRGEMSPHKRASRHLDDKSATRTSESKFPDSPLFGHLPKTWIDLNSSMSDSSVNYDTEGAAPLRREPAEVTVFVKKTR